MKKSIKKIIVVMLVMISVLSFAACKSSTPCRACRDTSTKGYKNEYTGEKEYYCDDCASDCEFCADEATEYYTSGLGSIVFVCDDCYEKYVK